MAIESKINAVINGKCPKCYQGNIFHNKWWQLKNFIKMNEKCPVCDITFEVEPGFFFGAMYLSYGLTMTIVLIGGLIIYYVFNDPTQFYYIIPITLVSILFTPINFRISRILYIHSMSGIKYKKIEK